MAKPNYSFEKRQRELAKKRKKEDKMAERAARKTGGGAGQEVADEAASVDPAPAEAGEGAPPVPPPAAGPGA